MIAIPEGEAQTAVRVFVAEIAADLRTIPAELADEDPAFGADSVAALERAIEKAVARLFRVIDGGV
jgi:hypothetical protein